MTLTQKLVRLKALLKHHKLLRSLLSSYSLYLAYPEKNSWGSIGEEEEEGIRQAILCASQYQGPIVEIGTLFGHTTNLLATLKQKDVPLIAVENFTWNPFGLPAEAHRHFTRRTLRYVMDHCSTEIFEGSAADFYRANTALKPSLVFLDANHEYDSIRQDIDWALATGCPVISGHDYTASYPGVIRAVNESFGDQISLYGTVWIHHAGGG